jgi:hypothetical protein
MYSTEVCKTLLVPSWSFATQHTSRFSAGRMGGKMQNEAVMRIALIIFLITVCPCSYCRRQAAQKNNPAIFFIN